MESCCYFIYLFILTAFPDNSASTASFCSALRTKPPRWSLKSKVASMVFSFVTVLHNLKSKPSTDIQTCQVVNYSPNVAGSSYCLWTNRNFPLLVRREIRTRRLQQRAQSFSFHPLPQSLLVFLALLAVHSRLVRSRDYLERDCEQSMISVLSKPSPT